MIRMTLLERWLDVPDQIGNRLQEVLYLLLECLLVKEMFTQGTVVDESFLAGPALLPPFS